jgi:hypothetical protein
MEELNLPLLLPPSPPSEAPSSDVVDALRSRALLNIPHIEREKALADLHCLAPPETDENPEFVANCLVRLDQAICSLRPKSTYLHAKMLSSEYVKNRKFKLQFLRADSFQPGAAAIRLASFFEAKTELFGSEKIVEDIRLRDLDKMDIRCLMESGYVQRLSEKDQAGRAIISCWLMKNQEEQDPITITIQNKVFTCSSFLKYCGNWCFSKCYFSLVGSITAEGFMVRVHGRD